MGNPIDLIGQRFGRLEVLFRVENDKDGRTRWLCKCDCGNEREVLGKCLRNGHTQSCGCLNKEVVSLKSFKDRTNERYGRLLVISRASDYVAPNGKKHVMWKCVCDCGNETVVDVCQLVQGHTKSCGCIANENARTFNFVHGGRKDRLYHVFANMKNRCYNSNATDYKYYGGRGIEICDEWRDNYAVFREWALNNGYDENAAKGKCTIDRIDVNGNYEPANCRWVDMKTQSRNRRNVINNDKCPRKNNDRNQTEFA